MTDQTKRLLSSALGLVALVLAHYLELQPEILAPVTAFGLYSLHWDPKKPV